MAKGRLRLEGTPQLLYGAENEMHKFQIRRETLTPCFQEKRRRWAALGSRGDIDHGVKKWHSLNSDERRPWQIRFRVDVFLEQRFTTAKKVLGTRNAAEWPCCGGRKICRPQCDDEAYRGGGCAIAPRPLPRKAKGAFSNRRSGDDIIKRLSGY